MSRRLVRWERKINPSAVCLRREEQSILKKLFFLFIDIVAFNLGPYFFLSELTAQIPLMAPHLLQNSLNSLVCLSRTCNIWFLNILFSCHPMWSFLTWAVLTTGLLKIVSYLWVPSCLGPWGFHPVGLSVPTLCIMATTNSSSFRNSLCPEKCFFLNFWRNHCSSVLWAPSMYPRAFLFISCCIPNFTF